ncbi:MAG TPA: hypothetical protein VIL72_02625, partial [Beijerinckiaceae bacterium]
MSCEGAWKPARGLSSPRWAGWGWLTALALVATAIALVETEAAVRGLVALFFGGLVGLCFAATRRPAFALLLVASLFAAIFAASDFKFGVMAMNLHVYDVFFHLFSVAQLSFFRETFGAAAAFAGGATLAALLALTLCWRREAAARLSRAALLGVTTASLLATAASGALLAQRGAHFFNARESVFSAFIASLGDVPALVRARGLFEIAAQASLDAAGAAPISCRPTQTPPDIVLFLNESAMPAGVYPQIPYPEE